MGNIRCLVVAYLAIACGGKHMPLIDGKGPKKMPKAVSPHHSGIAGEKLYRHCYDSLRSIPGKSNAKELMASCKKVEVKKECFTQKGRPVFHYDKKSKRKKKAKVLAIALVHGDELPSGDVARAWMERLNSLGPRNSWRIIPMANPDGVALKTRPNANRVDINRNFPTKKWKSLAIRMWKERYKSTWRKYPGPFAGSEPETQCLMAHIEEFGPDFVISIHTPLGHLDFDGPKVKNPGRAPLPWRRFGHFPGSLGRYMWRDRKIPVLTIELKGNSPVQGLKIFDNLQDVSGTLARKALMEMNARNISIDH